MQLIVAVAVAGAVIVAVRALSRSAGAKFDCQAQTIGAIGEADRERRCPGYEIPTTPTSPGIPVTPPGGTTSSLVAARASPNVPVPVPKPCLPDSYATSCAGDVLDYCDNGAPSSFDCQVPGMICVAGTCVVPSLGHPVNMVVRDFHEPGYKDKLLVTVFGDEGVRRAAQQVIDDYNALGTGAPRLELLPAGVAYGADIRLFGNRNPEALGFGVLGQSTSWPGTDGHPDSPTKVEVVEDTAFQERITICHELGHALGIGHIARGTCMDSCMRPTLEARASCEQSPTWDRPAPEVEGRLLRQIYGHDDGPPPCPGAPAGAQRCYQANQRCAYHEGSPPGCFTACRCEPIAHAALRGVVVNGWHCAEVCEPAP